jgi:hypothetical protein
MGAKEGSEYPISRQNVDLSSPYLKYMPPKLTENSLSLSFIVL